MTNEVEKIKAIYSEGVDREWDRLVKDEFHRLEYDTTWYYLDRYLPETGFILDAGGGPGRYTVDLARRGYAVVLLDLAPANLKRAKTEAVRAEVSAQIRSFEEGSITDLSRFENNFFEGVLCTGGPLSHVYPQSERQKALSELVRVTKPGYCLFISVMSRYGVLLATPTGWPYQSTRKELFEQILETGDHFEFVKDGYCHFYTSQELERDFRNLGVEIVAKVGLEGLNVQESALAFVANYPEAWKKWRELHYSWCTDPFVVDASGHMLFVARKK